MIEGGRVVGGRDGVAVGQEVAPCRQEGRKVTIVLREGYWCACVFRRAHLREPLGEREADDRSYKDVRRRSVACHRTPKPGTNGHS